MSENIIKEIETFKKVQSNYPKDSEAYKRIDKIIDKLNQLLVRNRNE